MNHAWIILYQEVRREGHAELLTLIALIVFPVTLYHLYKTPFQNNGLNSESTVSFDSFMYHKKKQLLRYRGLWTH